MARTLSLDLRKRVVDAVVEEAAQFGVSASGASAKSRERIPHLGAPELSGECSPRSAADVRRTRRSGPAMALSVPSSSRLTTAQLPHS
jgi:hypothetical protein